MCLSIVYEGKQKREALAKLPKSGYYWKAVVSSVGARFYRGPFFGGYYKYGWNKTIPTKGRLISKYLLAYHAFRGKKDALLWIGSRSWMKLVRCKVERKDIGNIGTQSTGSLAGKPQVLCIVTKRIWMPKPTKP